MYDNKAKEDAAKINRTYRFYTDDADEGGGDDDEEDNDDDNDDDEDNKGNEDVAKLTRPSCQQRWCSL